MSALLDGKVAIVTGAARGIGRGIAETYAAEGATVVVSDVDQAGAEAVASALEGAEAVACDVRDEAQVQALVEGAVERHGAVHVTVANAGIGGTPALVVETTLQQWRDLMAINLDGVFLTVKHAGRAMAAGEGGAIVTIASITSLSPFALVSPYAASKAAVASLTKTAAIELRDAGVRVNAICPGFIKTALVEEARGDLEAAAKMDLDEVIGAVQGGYAQEADVARLAVFLASERSSFSTGSLFVVDNGLSASLL